jgi:hypothetical protein
MTQANYALRLQASLKAKAERLAKAEGTTLNRFINVAVAEKIAALRTADFFRDRARRPRPARQHRRGHGLASGLYAAFGPNAASQAEMPGWFARSSNPEGSIARMAGSAWATVAKTGRLPPAPHQERV